MSEKKYSLEVLPKYCVKRFEYNPDFIFNHGMREVIIHDDSKSIYENPSVTDKEAFRVTLASMRGDIRSLGSDSTGKYSLKDGKYNPDFDFSYLNRKDLTIVDITNYIDKLQSQLENFDDELKLKIQEELNKASEMKETLEKERKPDSTGFSSSTGSTGSAQ